MIDRITIRQVDGGEMLDLLFWLDNYAFRPTPPFPDREEWEERIKTHKGTAYYAAFEGDKGVAITACPKFTQNLRGKIFKMGGFAAVSTHPEARRKGYSHKLICHAFETLANEGDILSSLYPFRESFYERLGYVTFPQTRNAIFNPSTMLPLLNKDFEGDVELTLLGDGFDDYHAYTKAMHPEVHGMAMFTDYEGQKEAAQSNRNWLLKAISDDELVGLMVYNLKGDEMMNYDLRAVRFYYRTSLGKYLLLSWLARHVDQAGKVEMWLPSFEQPNTWLSDIRPKLEPVFLAPMGRVLDVAGVGGMRTGTGAFTARISDPMCPWNDGTWKFMGDSGALEVIRAQAADCDLTIQGLSALVYGVNDPADFKVRGWGNPSIEIQEVMREMFPPMLPYLHEYF
jgi:GNAT superfamily N-acetyltransferase